MFNVLAVAVIVLAVIALGAAIIWAITSNLRQGEAFRQQLGERLGRLRLQGGLQRFGIDPARYLHTEPIVGIEDQMRQCRACEETARCDDTLGKPAFQEEDFAFCPNYSKLQDMVAPSRSQRSLEHT